MVRLFYHKAFMMLCPICRHGETKEGRTTITLERAGVIVVFKDVPAEICENCGEDFLSAEVGQELWEWFEDAVNKGEELSVARYTPRAA